MTVLAFGGQVQGTFSHEGKGPISGVKLRATREPARNSNLRVGHDSSICCYADIECNFPLNGLAGLPDFSAVMQSRGGRSVLEANIGVVCHSVVLE